MFTITNHIRSLEETRDFANTQANGLIDRSMSAEKFTRELQSNAQQAYNWVTDKGSWPLSIADLKEVHKVLCGDLQTGGGVCDPKAAQSYEQACKEFQTNVYEAKESLHQTPERAQEKVTIAIAEHLARCEAIPLFADHNSTVNRLACEVNMDMILGRAQRPGVDQGHYVQALQEAQNGSPKNLAFMIANNHNQALEAKKELWPFQTQELGPDYTNNWKAQDASQSR